MDGDQLHRLGIVIHHENSERLVLRERQQLVEAANRDPVAQWNHPRWWINRLKQDHPSRWQAILRANNLQAPMTLRVNSRMATQQQYLETLAVAGIGAVPVGRQGVVLDKARAVHELPGFDSGVVSVQDAAAQMAAQLLLGGLDLQTSQTNRLQVLDACAAPGGKTAHLLELADCDVTALDIDAQRCARIHETLARLKLQAQVVAADAARPDLWWNGILFDAILLDAPCTASGIVAAIPTCAGCAAKPTSPNSPACRPASCKSSGHWSSRAGGCCTAPARSSGPRATYRYKRFLRTTPTPYCGRHQAI